MRKGIGVGQVFLYDDKNQNGKLDLVGPGELPIDMIIGHSNEGIFFSDGSSQFNPFDVLQQALCPSKEAPPLEEGFSLVRFEDEDVTFDEGDEQKCWTKIVVLAKNEPIVAQLDIEASQSSQCLFEAQFNTTVTNHEDVITEDLPDLAEYDFMQCADLTVVYFKATQESVCTPYDVKNDTFSPVSPTPADWPCPIVVNN